jgi:glutaryl-CoA dehydrogenase
LGAIGAAMDAAIPLCVTQKKEYNLTNPLQEHNCNKKISEMITEITKAQLLTWRLGVLETKDATTTQISMAKRTM